MVRLQDEFGPKAADAPLGPSTSGPSRGRFRFHASHASSLPGYGGPGRFTGAHRDGSSGGQFLTDPSGDHPWWPPFAKRRTVPSWRSTTTKSLPFWGGLDLATTTARRPWGPTMQVLMPCMGYDGLWDWLSGLRSFHHKRAIPATRLMNSIVATDTDLMNNLRRLSESFPLCPESSVIASCSPIQTGRAGAPLLCSTVK